MKKTRVLVLGNDPQINSIEFDQLAPDVITLGVNRIWLKHIPNYFFFHDLHIIQELEHHAELREKLIRHATTYSSDWLSQSLRKKNIQIPSWINLHARQRGLLFPDSVTTSLDLFSKHYKKNLDCTYYVAGVSLMWQEPSHFWKAENYSALNKFGPDWYVPRFNRILENFKHLNARGFEVVSVNPKSLLNKTFRYENIENLYRKTL